MADKGILNQLMPSNHRGLPFNGDYNIQYIGTYIHTIERDNIHTNTNVILLKIDPYHECHALLAYKPQSDTNDGPQYHGIETVTGTPLAYIHLTISLSVYID